MSAPRRTSKGSVAGQNASQQKAVGPENEVDETLYAIDAAIEKDRNGGSQPESSNQDNSKGKRRFTGVDLLFIEHVDWRGANGKTWHCKFCGFSQASTMCRVR